MADIVDSATRSRMMAGIRNKNTKPEVIVRSLLHRAGFRFRLHARHLPGNPDIVFPRYKAVVFVHGCFWHGHDCPLFKWPTTRPEFWRNKIDRNQLNDRRAFSLLVEAGWRVAVVWECVLRGKERNLEEVVRKLADWLPDTDTQLIELAASTALPRFSVVKPEGHLVARPVGME
jgi:DNA mismatch endonuclease (patch repair protein)